MPNFGKLIKVDTSMSIVYIKLPKTGLGNMLLVWARGVVFARVNNLPLSCSTWWVFRWGALLRTENRNRLYWGYFKETSIYSQTKVKLNQIIKPVVVEPTVTKLPADEKNGKVFVFNKVITNEDLFSDIRGYKKMVSHELYAMLMPKVRRQIEMAKTPEIAVHIRRGDFKIANPVTPLSYFVEVIKKIRAEYGHALHVTVFTDADTDEVADVLSLDNVNLATPKSDIADIIVMSKAKYIVLS